jgi:hypothetical protein
MPSLDRSELLSTFRRPFNPQLLITEIETPSLVVWEGVSGHDAWGTTTIRFQRDRIDDGIVVRFSHQMGPDHLSDDSVASANFNWGYYLESLRLLCETGQVSRINQALRGKSGCDHICVSLVCPDLLQR